jgi:hypothetical protein
MKPVGKVGEGCALGTKVGKKYQLRGREMYHSRDWWL